MLALDGTLEILFKATIVLKETDLERLQFAPGHQYIFITGIN